MELESQNSSVKKMTNGTEISDSYWFCGYNNINNVNNINNNNSLQNTMSDNDHKEHHIYHELLTATKSNKFQFHHTKSRLKIANKQNNNNNACNDIDPFFSDYEDDEDIDNEVDYKLATKSLKNLLHVDKNEISILLMSLPLSIQVGILQFVPCDDKLYECRFVCRYWYYLLTWHQELPTKQLQFLFPNECDYIMASPFINGISRGNHAMILSSLGIGIYINNKFHSMISKIDKIQLRHSNKELKTKEMKAISKFLTVNQNIKLIDLSDCKLNDFCVQLLCYGLKHNQSVQHLMLSRNKITCNGCKYIAYCLQFNHCLQSLWIRSNNIQNKGLKYISQGLHFNHKLKKLSIDNNNISNQRYKFYEKLLSQTITKTQNKYNTYNASDLMNKLKANILNIKSLSSMSLLSMKKSESNASSSSASLDDEDDDDYKQNNNDNNDEMDDENLLFSLQRISSFNVPFIKLTDDEINTQNYVANYYPDIDINKMNDKDDDFIDKIDGFLMFAHLFATNNNNGNCGLEVVSMRDNNISSTGVTLLSKALINNHILKELHFSYNNVDERGLFSLFSLLKYYSKCKKEIGRQYGLDIYVKSGNKLDQTPIWDDIYEEYTNPESDSGVPFGHIF